ncbi:GNAT family N-acetyltransferase [Chitinophaga nivalis]|uniref:GNAT family N-acetyltransferase n=1 Tax=Chitinophaga nivalis TaxID=2991709 RepID=A0ABT3IQ84_9BACT|nr:GNAT family N-acetyltransferase [Chitinophaga nivalis]MCW3464359.1 GNAT family N-acetyltransferase [Chitinophaga nivalis]MCW3485950.1 GNAT family N-acetyltransferase [Chitinophaga nivalis]
MKIYRNLPAEFVKEAGALFATAFETKFSYFLGDRSAIQKIISSLINPSQVIAVVSDTNELMGIAGFSYKKKHMLSIGMKAMIQQYGIVKGIGKIIQLGIYFPNEFPMSYIYIDAVTVKATYRGQGISRILLAELEQIAVEYGVTNLQLDVDVANTVAVKAYEKTGFREAGVQTLSAHAARRIGMTQVSRMLKIVEKQRG